VSEPEVAIRRPRRTLRTVVAILGYAGILLLAFRTIDRTRFAEGLAKLSLFDVLIVLSVSLVHIAGRALRYHFLLRQAEPRDYRVLDGVRIFLIGLSASAVTPARAGDFIKARLVRPHGVSTSVGLGLVFVERSLDLIVVAASIVLAGFGLAGHGASDAWRDASIALLVALVIGTLAISVRPIRRRLFGVVVDLVRRVRPAADHGSLGEKLESMFGVWDAVFRSGPRLAAMLLYSALVWAVEFSKLWLVLRFVGAPIDPLVAYFVYPASIVAGILTLLPFSEGVVGLTGVALLVALGHVDSGLATIAVAVDRAASVLPPLGLWLVLWLLDKRRASTATAIDAP
jgi:uncharacterized protein (TIRG00374 family)